MTLLDLGAGHHVDPSRIIGVRPAPSGSAVVIDLTDGREIRIQVETVDREGAVKEADRIAALVNGTLAWTPGKMHNDTNLVQPLNTSVVDIVPRLTGDPIVAARTLLTQMDIQQPKAVVCGTHSDDLRTMLRALLDAIDAVDAGAAEAKQTP